MANTYPFGQAINFSWMYKDQTGAPIDPTNGNIKISFYRAQTGATVQSYVYPTDGVIVRDGVGTYHCIYLPPSHGDWTARVEKDDANQGAFEQAFTVSLSPFYPTS